MNNKLSNNKSVNRKISGKGEGTMKNKVVRELKNFWREEDGMGSVEVILIVVILIGLVVLFKDTIEPIIQEAISSIKTDGKGLNVKGKAGK